MASIISVPRHCFFRGMLTFSRYVLCFSYFICKRLFYQNYVQLTIICSNSPVLNGSLPFWEDSSRSPVSHWNLPFWDDPGLLVRCLWIFQVHNTFYTFDVKILVAINKIKSVRCSWSLSLPWAIDPCQQRTSYFSTIERTPGKFSLEIGRKSLKIDTVCNF